MKKLLILAICLIPLKSFAYTQDSGKITNIFVSPTGSIAFKVNNGREGIPNAVAVYSCSSGGGWIGHNSADPVLKSAVLAAKAANMDIVITIEGCEGDWFKVKDMYIN
jgi:hypothetical protein